MQLSKCCKGKDWITHAIFTGAAVMLLVFVISLFFPKQWLVSGRIVVFPSGQPMSASQNLFPEVGNTAEIIKSEFFQKNNFGEQAVNFEGAKILKNSSMVLVKFRSPESDIQAFEDLIVSVPSQVNDYTRDLYGGSPFKYKMAGDPEISESPVRPNLFLNAIIGFLAGVILYLIYWFGFEFIQPASEEIKTESVEKAIFLPETKPIKSVDKKISESAFPAGDGEIVIKNERPHFEPKKMGEKRSAAPENLPIADGEPTDEEVKDRLNRLMRGEL